MDGVRSESAAQYFQNFSTSRENSEPITAVVKGTVPKWLHGSFLRNGGGKYEVGHDKYNCVFDGLALLHLFEINAGRVTYRSRFLRSEAYKEAVAANRIVISEVGTFAYPDPCKSIFERFLSFFLPERVSDNDNVNVMKVGEEFYACTELQYIRRIDPKTLESAENKLDISNYIAVHGATAHPHEDKDGTVYNMGSRYGLNAVYNIITIPPPDKGVHDDPYQKAFVSTTIQRSDGSTSYYHSFGMTDNYFIFVEQPLIVKEWQVLSKRFFQKTYADCVEWNPSMKTLFHVIRRDTGQILPMTYKADAFAVFHHVNAFEEGGHLIVDVCAYKGGIDFQTLKLDEMKEGLVPLNSQLWRFILPLTYTLNSKMGDNLVKIENSTASAAAMEDGSIHCKPEILFETVTELPKINYREFNGKPYRYVYGISEWFKKLVKFDLEEKTLKFWQEDHHFTSEPVFVPKPGSTMEDDGVVLSSVMSTNESPSFLLILDGKSFTEIARAQIPLKITCAFHGRFDGCTNSSENPVRT
ncbi:carotenoid-cleaving dioxygenase, mitochondrial-like [Ptychodera flava]|uniref:carotenoid-cleaving dioxygenase, mitochondrial-like n=1 Tax=Ptychodera flava TaxID=63121 RepID=UPI003969EFAD